MSYAALLIHTVEVRRRLAGVDRFGQPIEPRADQFADATYPGRLDAGSGGERYTDRSRDVVEFSHRLFLPANVDLFEADKVTVLAETGDVLVSNADVKEVQKVWDAFGVHHVEAKLQAVRSGER